jgi:hypothetical protein
MSEEDIIMNMSEEILRLKKELRKYKYTKEVPYSKATSSIKMEFYWDEGNDVRPPHPRVFFHPKNGVGQDMPLFKLVESKFHFIGDKQ